MKITPLLTLLLWAPTALAGNATLLAIDDSRVTRIAADQATATKQLQTWADAIAKGEKELHHREAREVFAMERDLYAVVSKNADAIAACSGPSQEACDAALKQGEAAEAEFESKHRDGPLWREYRQTYGELTIGTSSLRNNLRLGRSQRVKENAWSEATARAKQAIAARTAALAQVQPDSDQATLEAALAAIEAADAACDAFRTLQRTSAPYPEGCPQSEVLTPDGSRSRQTRTQQVALIKNRLPASARFSNASLCEQPCGNPSLCPPACPGPLGEAAVYPNIRFGDVDAHVQVRTLFETVHPSRYRFLTRDVLIDGVVVAARGEVVLITTLEPATRGSVLVLTLANDTLTVPGTSLSATRIKGAKLTRVRQAQCVVLGPDASGKLARLGSGWDTEVDDSPPEGEPAFLQLMDPNDKAYVNFVKASDAFVSCYEKKMKSLDPDGTAWRYVRETYVTRTGETVKVEKLDEALRRQACASCGCRKFNTTRAALAKTVLGPMQKKELEAYEATVALIEKRLSP